VTGPSVRAVSAAQRRHATCGFESHLWHQRQAYPQEESRGDARRAVNLFAKPARPGQCSGRAFTLVARVRIPLGTPIRLVFLSKYLISMDLSGFLGKVPWNPRGGPGRSFRTGGQVASIAIGRLSHALPEPACGLAAGRRFASSPATAVGRLRRSEPELCPGAQRRLPKRAPGWTPTRHETRDFPRSAAGATSLLNGSADLLIEVLQKPRARRAQARSKRSRFMTLSHAATKSLTNASCESSHAYTSAIARS
jgi:hypothetical protein